VQASTIAKAEYRAATDTFHRAQAELHRDFRDAANERGHRQEEGRGAVAIAQPIYADKSKADENRARADGLTREASAIRSVVVVMTRAAPCRIVLMLVSKLFDRRRECDYPGSGCLLSAVATLDELKKVVPELPGADLISGFFARFPHAEAFPANNLLGQLPLTLAGPSRCRPR